MMLRPVELHATGNPRPQQANESGFDHILPVEEIVAVRLVLADVNAAPDLRQDHQADV